MVGHPLIKLGGLALGLCLVSPPAVALEYELAVATGTSVGGEIPEETFLFLGPPRLDGGDLLFLADTSAGRTGLWLFRGGAFTQILDYWEPVPGGLPDEHWELFWDIDLEQGRVAFFATTLSVPSQFYNPGVWIWDEAGGLRRIADKYVEPPGVPGGRYEDVATASFDGSGGVIFLGTPTGETWGSMFRWEAEETVRLAGPGDSVPGVGTLFRFWRQPDARDGTVVSGVTFSDSPARIMRWNGTSLESLWAHGDPMPGAPPGVGLEQSLTYGFGSGAGPVAFGVGVPDWLGIYVHEGGAWRPIVDSTLTDPVTGQPASWLHERGVSRDAGWLGFRAHFPGGINILFAADDTTGELVELARDGGEIEGHPVGVVDVGGHWMSEEQAAFRVLGPSGDQIWVASLGDPPSPSPLEIPTLDQGALLVLVLLLALAGWRAARRT